MGTTSIKPARLSDAIADHIQQLVLEGALRPGERLLSERDLSAKLRVSRPSLREALDKLIDMGLLTTNAQGAAFVSEQVGKSLRDPLGPLMEMPGARMAALELRSVVEVAAAGFAAERASDVDREVITKQFKAIGAAHDAEDPDKIAKADTEFHFAIYEASHNPMMLHFMRSLETTLRSIVYLDRQNAGERKVQKEVHLNDHLAIYEAIMAGDAVRAGEAAQSHMGSALQTQCDIFEAQQRLEASVRRLARNDLVASERRRKSVS